MGGHQYTPEEIASWPKPNYHNPMRRGWGLVALCIALFVLALGIVIARLYARIRIQRNYGLDDTLIIAAIVPTLGVVISTCLASKVYGFDLHVWDIPPAVQLQTRQISMVIQEFYLFSTCLTKISILCFYRRMTAGTVSKKFRTTVWISIAFIVAFLITFVILAAAQCLPVEAYWLRLNPVWATTHKSKCINEPVGVIIAGSISIVQDFIACGLPIMLFWKLQMPLRQKIALGIIFGVGAFLCVAGILRLYYVYNYFYLSEDGTWTAQNIWIWAVVESHMAIVCASAPALKVFFKKILSASGLGSHLSGSLKRARGHSRSKGYGGNTSPSQNTKDDPSISYNASASRGGSNEMPRLKNSWTRDVELANIKVAREVDIIYEIRDMDVDGDASSGRSSAELKPVEPRRFHYPNRNVEGRIWQQ